MSKCDLYIKGRQVNLEDFMPSEISQSQKKTNPCNSTYVKYLEGSQSWQQKVGKRLPQAEGTKGSPLKGVEFQFYEGQKFRR